MSVPDAAHKKHSVGTVSEVNPKNFRRTLRLTFFLPVICIIALVLILSLLTSYLFSQAEWTNHTDQVVGQAYYCQQLIIDMETGIRGFEATKSSVFLEPYKASDLRIQNEFNQLSNLVRDNDSQTRRVKVLKSTFAEWKSVATNMLSITGTANSAKAVALDLKGKELMDSIRSIFAIFVEKEKELRQSRNAEVVRLRRNFLIARIGFGIPLALALGWFLRKKLLELTAEHNRILSSIRAQKEWLQVTLDSIGDAVITTDLEGKITALNPVAQSMTGWSISEALDLPLERVFRIVNEQTRTTAENPIQKVLKEGKIVGLANHTALISKRGDEISIEDSAAPIKDESGRILGAVMVFHDVTEQRKSERKLAESESRKSAILMAALDAIVTMDHEGKVVDFNPAAERIFGYSQEEAIGAFMADLIIPERLRKRHIEGLAKYLATGEGPVLGKRIELPAICSNGREIMVELAIVPIAGMNPPMFTSTLRDITRSKAAEILAAERARFAALRADVASALVEGKTIPGVLQSCCAALVKHLEAAFARIWTLNEAQGFLELKASAGLYTHLDGAHGRIKVGEYKIGRIAKNAGALLSNDVVNDPNISDPEWARKEGMVSFAGYPMIVDGIVVGVLAMFSRSPLSSVFNELEPIVATIAQWLKRKRTEETLKETKARLETTLVATEVATWTWDIINDRVFADRNLAQMFSVSKEIAAGGAIGNYLASIHPLDRARVQELIQKTLVGENAIFEVDYRLVKPDKSVRWVVARGVVERDQAGKPMWFPGVVIDITDRKVAEEALGLQREWLKVTLASIGDAVITTDVRGNITFINPIAAKLTGWSVEEALGAPMEKVFRIHNELTLAPSENPVVKVLRERTIVALANHTALVSKDNRTISIEDSAAPILDGEGNIIGVVMVFHDATEQRRAEKVQREGAEKLRFMAESMPQMIFTLKANGEIDYFNGQWADFTGQILERQGPWNWSAFVYPSDLDKTNQQWNLALKNGTPFKIEHRFKRMDGEYHWHLTRAQAMRDGDNKISNWVGSSTDIDDQKRAEEHLESTVKQRTLKLQETIAHLEEFSYSVAHDLRAPLRAMQGYANAILSDYSERLDDHGRDYLQRIVNAGLRMDRLTLDVLTYTKVARTSLICQPVNLDRLIGDIIQQYSQLQPPAAEMTVERPLHSVQAHDPSLGQAVSNLLTNAVKFVARGVKPKVKIWTELRGDQVRLWVQDNGIGIKPEHQGRLFGMFERLNTHGQYEGTGIGLAIVRKSIEKMGGTTGVESDGITGSKFWIQLRK